MHERWTRDVGSISQQHPDVSADPNASAPSVVNGTVYVSLAGDEEQPGAGVLALDAKDGTTEWYTAVGKSYYSFGRLPQPTVLDGTVVAAFPRTRDGTDVFALAAETGEEQWRAESDLAVETAGIGRDGQFVFGSETAFALGADGSLSWEYDKAPESARGANALTPPTVTDGAAYVPTGRSLCALDHDGNERWIRKLTFGVGGPYTAAGPYTPVAGESVYVATEWTGLADGKLLALDPEDGTTQWEFKPSFDAERRKRLIREHENDEGTQPDLTVGVYLTPALSDGTLFALGYGLPEAERYSHVPKVFAIDASDGSAQWATDLPGDFVRTSPVVAGGQVYVATKNGLVVIDSDSGTQQYHDSALPGKISGLGIVGDVLYASDGYNIAAIGPS